jgi:threonylcarbamoyladenosine tRNA methylthiotransferase MtaB
MRVFLQALGCRLNEAELETWSRDCRARGYQLAGCAEQADLVVINTCAVTAESVRKSRQLIRRAQRDNPTAKLVVSGCYASLDEPLPAAELGIDLLVPNADKDRLVEIAAERLDLPVMPESATEPGENTLLARGRQRAFVKVQDGCRYRCTFCIVTRARGEERSRPLDEVVAEVERIHASGIQEVVLAGVHLGGYGSDTGADLAGLVRAVLERTAIPRLRLGSLEPWELTPDFWALFDDPRLMPHLHLPLQSGADSVLRRMARRCRTADFRALVEQARRALPGFNVTTDVIVGFPGETAAEWQQTLDFVREMAFGHVHIFAYSARAGTKAATLPDPVPREVSRARSEELHALARQSRQRVLEAAVGATYPVLVEGHDPASGTWSGYTPGYLRIVLPAPADAGLANRIVALRATAVGHDGEHLLGEPDRSSATTGPSRADACSR